MAYWLMKSEPFVYSWEDLQKDGTTKWDGVRNYAARNCLRDMKVGDEAFLYYSNEGKAVVAVMKVVKTHEADATVEKDELNKDGSNPWLVVTVAPGKKLKRPVTLEAIKRNERLKGMA